MVRVRLRGFRAIDRRTAGAREAMAFKRELVAALGGEDELSPQRRRLVDLAVRASILIDHVDVWLLEQRSLVNARTRTLVPVLGQRTALAEHLARILGQLGLERRARRVPDLREYVEARYGASESRAANGGGERAQAQDAAPASPAATTPRDRERAKAAGRAEDGWSV
jgi:hypothetical protein